MDSPANPGELPLQRYGRELCGLMVAAIDFRRIPLTPPLTQHLSYRGDLIRVAEFMSEVNLRDTAPCEEIARPIWEDIADEILASIEKRGRFALRPAERDVRIVFQWWLEMNWLRRIMYRLGGERPPFPSGRPLKKVLPNG